MGAGKPRVRLTSNFDGPINFVAGLYSFEVDYEQYWDVGHLHWTYNQVLGFPLFPDITAPTSLKTQGQRQQTDSSAAFVSADWAITDRLTFTLGGRYTKEEKDFSGDDGSIGYRPRCGRGSSDRPRNLGEVCRSGQSLRQVAHSALILTKTLMLWASYAEGFKSGGFFGRQANFQNIDVTFEPESVDNIELGFKSSLLDGRMTLNAAYFQSDYENKQESVLVLAVWQMSPLSLEMPRRKKSKEWKSTSVFRSLKTGSSAPTTAISMRATTNLSQTSTVALKLS